jgi:hypothetical protein
MKPWVGSLATHTYIYKCQIVLPCMVVYACNPSTQRLSQEDQEYEASMGYIMSSRSAWGYIVRPCLKKQTNKQTNTNK